MKIDIKDIEKGHFVVYEMETKKEFWKIISKESKFALEFFTTKSIIDGRMHRLPIAFLELEKNKDCFHVYDNLDEIKFDFPEYFI